MSTPSDHGLESAFDALVAARPAGIGGAIFAISSAHSGSGTSHVARQLALIASAQPGAVQNACVVDLDIQKNSQSAFFFAPENQAMYGPPGGPYDATFGTAPFWRVSPHAIGPGASMGDSQYVSMYICERARLTFTHFNWDEVNTGQTVHLQNAPDFWHALRLQFSHIFVDTPAQDRSDVLSAIAPLADGTVLISNAVHKNSEAIDQAAQRIVAAGGFCPGVIINEHIGTPPTPETVPTPRPAPAGSGATSSA